MSEESKFLAIFGASGSSGGGGGGNTIYTANDSLTGDRTVDLSSNTLKFENGQTYIDSGSFNPLVINRKGSGTLGNGIDFNAYNSSNAETNFARIIQVATDSTAGSEDGGLWFRTMIAGTLRTPVVLDNREFLIDAVNFTDNFFRVKDGSIDCLKVNTNNQTYIESGSFNPLVINRKGAGTIGNGIDFNAYNSSSSEHNFARIIQIATSTTAGSENGGLQLRVSDSGTITTKINIETATTEFSNEGVFTKKAKVYGLDTLSTSTAFQIYDGDGTPSSLWDIRNNGDLYLGKETTVRSDFQEMLTLESSATNPSLVLNALSSGSNTNIEFAEVNSKKWLIGNVASDDSFRIFNYQNLTTPISISNANKINILAPTTTTKELNIGNTTLIEASDVTPLTVKSDANGNMQIEVDSTSTSYNSQVKYSQGGSEKWLAGVDNAQSFRFYNFGTSSVSFKIDSSDNATLIGTLDMSNKRILNSVVNPSVQETASTSTLTINSDEQTDGVLTAMATNLAIASPTGTPVQSQSLVFRFKDDGSARTLTWNAIFRAIGVTLPTTTTASKLLYVGCKYNSTDTKWDVVSVQEEA